MRAGVDYVLWPGQLGVLEEIGDGQSAAVMGAVSDALQEGQVISVHPSAQIAGRFGAAAGLRGFGLYDFGQRLEQGALEIGAGDIIVVPQASGLHVDQLDVISAQVDRLGAKLIYLSDPSLDAGGSGLRHISERVEVHRLGGLEVLPEMRRGLLGVGPELEGSIDTLWRSDALRGQKDQAEQIAAFAERYVDSGVSGKLGIGGSARIADQLNREIERVRRDAGFN